LIVVDTNVVIKWAVPEPGTEAALALLGGPMIAPDVLVVELGHVLTKKVRRRELKAEVASAAFIRIPSQLTLTNSRALDMRAFELSISMHHGIHDCYFLALAEISETILLTADAVLVAKVRQSGLGRWIRQLGDPSPDD